jgi:hypothetical protein
MLILVDIEKGVKYIEAAGINKKFSKTHDFARAKL